jgi:hypothetical protein
MGRGQADMCSNEVTISFSEDGHPGLSLRRYAAEKESRRYVGAGGPGSSLWQVNGGILVCRALAKNLWKEC